MVVACIVIIASQLDEVVYKALVIFLMGSVIYLGSLLVAQEESCTTDAECIEQTGEYPDDERVYN